jgi:hypothetical protein
VSANPAEGERYFPQVLLNHVPGATSWRHLRTVNGVHYHSFCDAACAAGLIEDDNTLDDCLTESAIFGCHPYCVSCSQQYECSVSRRMSLVCGQNTLTQWRKTSSIRIQTLIRWNKWLLGNLVKPCHPRNVGLPKFMRQVREAAL